ncbi:MAG: cytochrome c3 family protein [Pseudomonadales bacterium]|jgi:hypothetical protein|nr:hypothetical protein [Gammaproteobacteria bacterium]MDP6026636.1 cytochrome c3 family protein [Pseudomonadales bacterium]MDP7450956.1 cytochrome c3 family protein [Arenicellales bacterium]MDP7315327.1 cytochrome c3 family protein [Pseudomonadales bacterium]MDP7577545.1 cytochrome c3 family protein [Pseudomonadales bacterium]|tara:strand:+ start:319 stop:687 length:369 start_codon:yes stop_codon:yes gene_type:complete
MKIFLCVLVLATTVLLTVGTPLPGEQPVKQNRWLSPDPILPMTFAHKTHKSENCLDCHHNYSDDTGGGPCMNCHVSDQEVWPLLETQFHDLCRGCHEDKQLAGEEGGPTRVCIECHLDEELP